jgi:YggT family protein
MHELIAFLQLLVNMYEWIIILSVVLSWLVGFGVINSYNPFVQSLRRLFAALTEPLLRPIRGLLPNVGNIDLSPLVLLLACLFVRSVVLPNVERLVA